MALSLPLTGSEIREKFEMMDLANWRNLPSFRAALTSGRNFLQSDKLAKSCSALCMRADGEIWLIHIGPRGGWKKLWNFGAPI